MGSPAVIHLRDDGSVYEPPKVTEPGQDVLHLDDSGSVIGRNGSLGLGSKPQLDIRSDNSFPGNPGPFIANIALPVAGGMIGSAVDAPMLGAGAGSLIGEGLKHLSPNNFSESEEAPSMGDSALNIGANMGLEGGNSIVNSLIKNRGFKPAMAELFASKMGQAVPGIKNATNNAKVAQGLSSATDGITNPAERDALKDALGKGSRGGRITNSDAISDALESKENRGIISQGSKDNVNTILDMAKDTYDPKNMSARFLHMGKTGLMLSAGGTVAHSLGVPGAAGVAGGLLIGNEVLGQIASNPTMSKLIIEGMKSPESSSAKLAREAIMFSLRGTEQYMMDSNGEKHKVIISKEGVPQLPR